MKIRVLGCGEAFSAGGRLHTCFYVETAGLRVLLDCGASSLCAMNRWGVPPDELDAICISHLHGDHFGGLTFLDAYLQHSKKRTKPKLLVAGPPNLKTVFHQALDAFYPKASETSVLEIQGFPLEIKGRIQVTALPVDHDPATQPHGLRLEADGKVLAFSGDTAWTETLIELSENADLFLCECTGYDSTPGKHLTYTQLQQHKSRLKNCRRLLLTHPGQEVLDRLPLELEFAEDGMQIEL